ncbi:KxYKxGKxW signal peptide domain-containing protein [Lacticaseibacillus suibinensis]|uniref:KxYKxGKxW signal peptide domain-containing protein n=1 Tax=Lacticaseibacillus suibinensis TaxID=2486011 RepID=UPI0035714F0D
MEVMPLGKKTGSSGDLFRNNSKVRFKMFKAGKRWLFAGTATLSGLLGGLLIAPHAVNADTTTPTVAKTVDQQDTLATQDTPQFQYPLRPDLRRPRRMLRLPSKHRRAPRSAFRNRHPNQL